MENAKAPDFLKTPENVDPEQYWLDHVYQPGARQLTVRAVITGMIIGVVMCLSNLYVVLKTGWSVGVTITACILAYAAFSALQGLKLTRHEFTPLENNAMGSVASAAGYMTGGGNMAALPALLMLTGYRPDTFGLILWFAVIAALGVFVAIPIKRQLVNHEQLAFPTGTATAVTIRALHGHAGEGRRQANALFLSGAIAGVVAILRDAVKLLPATLPAFGKKAAGWTFGIQFSVLLVGAGMLIGFKTGWSMLLGAIVNFGFVVPAMVEQGAITGDKFNHFLQWSLWSGAALFVSSGLMSFALQWKMVARSFSGLGQVFSRNKGATTEETDRMAAVECPAWWFPAGFVLLGPVIVWLCSSLFGIPWWAGILSLPLAFFMGIIASRVTGETDVTPTKALGPVTQMIYGGVLPGNMTANIMSANVTGGVGLHAADLLTDLKSGFLLGANPRQQFYAQMFGVVAGAAVVVPAFNLLVPTADVLGSEQFPAPGAAVWAGVSEVLVKGVSALHPTAQLAAMICVGLGAALALAERFAPAKARPFIPSAAGLGIATMVPAHNSIAFFTGALIAEVMRRVWPKAAERYVLPVGSGFIAGESILGVIIAMGIAFGFIPK